MSLFDKLFYRKKESQLEKKDSAKMIEVMLLQAELFLEDGKDDWAVEQYKSILNLCSNATAQYNLGSLYAQGKGVAQDLCKGAYYFRQAEKNGDVTASKMVRKCELDYMNQALDGENAAELYERMRRFAGTVYPEEASGRVGQELTALGSYYMDKKEYSKAIKLLRAAAEFCNNGQAQNVLGVLYNAGSGVPKNDLISLYWFDRAADHGIAAARTDRDGILNAYRSSLSAEEFSEYMEQLACWCREGSADVPKMPERAERWHSLAQQNGKATPSAQGTPRAEDALSIKQERMRILQLCVKKMIGMIPERTGPDGACSPFKLQFQFPGTGNVGMLCLNTSKLEGKPYSLTMEVFHSADSVFSVCFLSGTLQNILEFLMDEKNLQQMVSTFRYLSDAVDEQL